MTWFVAFTASAKRDLKKAKNTPHRARIEEFVACSAIDPFFVPPPFETLSADLKGAYSRRINIQHRFVFSVRTELSTEYHEQIGVDVDDEPFEGVVIVSRCWGHY